ncbi:hypothetical protein PGTUg99_029403 [Puccinia graminis f. sp. tritici]|uniref:No apical meristem-associated C-terminal domain-containing protein n=1 Tax=Puccinia graminis f. sp. tritici TaxID=56615 RepID=A0A5B0PN49_PUCGR|nr:hypothetical protein PGTUg99_029403 [Puccinia graminis f. sp. tritici]
MKAHYEQGGKQFIYEQAWLVLKDLPKWSNLSQNCSTQNSDGPISTLTLSTPVVQSEASPAVSQTSKREEDLPDDLSKEFLRLQKEMIVHDLCEQVEQQQKLAAQKAKESKQSVSSSTQAAASSSTQVVTSSLLPTSEPKSSKESSSDVDDEILEEINPTLE